MMLQNRDTDRFRSACRRAASIVHRKQDYIHETRKLYLMFLRGVALVE